MAGERQRRGGRDFLKRAGFGIAAGLSALVAAALVPAARAGVSGDAPPEVAFRTQAIRLARHKIIAEIAETPEGRERGLMFRASLADGHGMLFVFESEETLAFWMKNTLIPLSIGYFSADKTLIDVQEMTPAAAGDLRPPTYPSAKPARFALEMPKGWFAKNKIELGSRLVYVPTRRPN
jgi:uncharacterized membrane protein (UPF0127 family)